jgi:filamentous hemagglutinin family protein
MMMNRDIFTNCARSSGCFAVWLLLVGTSHAEIVFDGTMTMGDPGLPLDGNMMIPEARGMLKGTNLFHSFSVFNVNAGESAVFTADTAGIDNVIGRVTGGISQVTGDSISHIDGSIISNIGADVWLINPNGIMFGEGGSLMVDGSFHASTADHIGFADGQFGADLNDPANTVLSVASPASFGFLGNNPGRIIIEKSQLDVDAGQTLSFVGGDIEITGAPSADFTGLGAWSGQINIVSTASAGQAIVDGAGFNVDNFEQLGDISISHNALLEASEIDNATGAGTVFIRGGNFTLNNAKIRANADDGFGGFVSIGVDNLSLTDGGVIDVATFGTGGDATGIVINAINSITISGKNPDPNSDLPHESGLYSETFGSGPGGNIELEAQRVIMDAGGTITAESKGGGHGGLISIKAPELSISGGAKIDTSTTYDSTGEAGLIFIDAEDLSLTNGGAILSDNRGDDLGGLITIKATQVSMANGKIEASTSGTGNAGDIGIEADVVRLTGDSEIASDVEIEFDGNDLPFVAEPGNGGSVSITARTITLESSNGEAPEISSDTEGGGGGFGNGGDVTLVASESIKLLNRTGGDLPGITADSKPGATGVAGDILIETPVLEMTGSEIKTNAKNSAGGIITIEAVDLVYLLDSEISATADSVTATDDGGNVIIDPTFVVLNNSSISANANQGFGGIIDITAQIFLKDQNSTVTATSQAGPQFDGLIIIDSASQDVTAAVTILDASFLDVSGLLRQPCSAAAERERSSFTVAGKGGVARAPNTYFPSTPQDIQPPTQASRIEQQNGETFIQVADRQAIPWERAEKLGCI